MALVLAFVATGALGVPAAAGDRVAGGAGPEELVVQVDDYFFTPARPTIGRGDTVTFDFVGDVTHTATDSSGLELFDTGNVPPAGGQVLSFTYQAAGVYHFVCTPHAGMAGYVTVPMRAAPATGRRHDAFTLVWAATAATGDQVFDVQVKRPGTAWTTWGSGLTARSGVFEPSKTGRFRFRARMRDLGLDAWSKWSPASSIRVR